MFVGVGGVKVSMVAFQAIDPGSIPGRRKKIFDLLICARYSFSRLHFKLHRKFNNIYPAKLKPVTWCHYFANVWNDFVSTSETRRDKRDAPSIYPAISTNLSHRKFVTNFEKYILYITQPQGRFELPTPGLRDQCSNHWAIEAPLKYENSASCKKKSRAKIKQ